MRFQGYLLLALLPLSAGAGDDFQPLYNGRDLSGWHAKDGRIDLWRADGELLVCEKGEKGKNGGGWLTTDKEYGDFVLRLEWKITADGNSGVGLRYPKDGEPSHEGMEIQILDDASPENAQRPPEELSGGIFAQKAPLRHADNPVGQWNQEEITCRGPYLRVVVNGVETLNVNLDDLKVLLGHHRQYKPVCDRPRRGFIGLQGDRGVHVEFRNLWIKEL
jgi:hypothetical protein